MNFEEEKEHFFLGRHRYAPRCSTKITVDFDAAIYLGNIKY